MTSDVVLVVPLAPDVTGNGLAMRAGMWLECLAAVGPVDLVIVPVSGAATPSAWSTTLARKIVVVDLPTDPARSRSFTTAQLADPVLRERLVRSQPLPERARLAPPVLAASIVERLGQRPDGVVVTMREYLAPLGLWVARASSARRRVLDLDDDVEAVLGQLGDDAGADAYGRLLRCWLPDADVVTAASPAEAEALTVRYSHTVTALPNAVRVPPEPPAPPDAGRLVFVGNLTYEPNVAAATTLVDEVLPLVRREIPTATVTLVGADDDRMARLADRRGTTVTGAVDDVGPHYASSDLAVVPLRTGAGTRIKVLEAMAHRRPVVATPTAVAGLGLDPGRDVAIGESPAQLAAATVALLRDRRRRSAMAAAAFATVTRDHTIDAVAPAVRRLVHGPDGDPNGDPGDDERRGASARE